MEIVKNRVALISGVADAVGQAVALRFAKNGAKVVVTDADKGKADEIAAKIKADGGEALAVAADPTNPAQVKKVVSEAKAKFGKIDILVNNVETYEGKGIADLSDEDWHQSVRSNMDPMFFFCREVIPGMREQKYGRVINMGNLEYVGWPGKANYSATKSAIFGFTRSLALETAKSDITVNCVAKGGAFESPGLSQEQVEKLAASMPVQRLGKSEDVARAVGFFASDASPYATGQTLFVCGGKSMYFSMTI